MLKKLKIKFMLFIALSLAIGSVTSLTHATGATFTNPIGPGADPFVVYSGGSYYLCGSDGNIFLKKATRLQDIAIASPNIVWTPPFGTAYSSDIWAPELHYLDGRWYIYFAADDGNNANHRMYVLEGGTDPENPLCAPYVFKGKIYDSTNQWAIDGTPIEYQGNKYFIWSGWPSNPSQNQYLYIAPMSNPWTISGARVEISRPDYDWEKAGTDGVNEGPEAIIRNGILYIIYSADGSWTDDYCLGQLKLTGTNILSKSSWTKKSTPVFQKTSQVFGPGHCSFVKSPDGTEDWIVYHAAVYSGAGWDRNIRTQKFTWNSDNTPNFGTPVNPGVAIYEPSGTISEPVPVFSGYYKIINRATGKAMEVEDGLMTDGANIQQWSYVGVNCQQWQLVNVGGYDFKIINKNSGKAAKVANAGVQLGDNIHQWNYDGSNSQKWFISSLGNGYYKIINKNSMLVMEVSDGNTSDGANIAQWSYVGANCQQWQIVSLGGTLPPTTVTIDNGTTGYSTTGTWSTTATGGYNNTSYQYATAGTAKTATWAPNLSTAGTWRVSIMYRAGTNRATSAKFNVATASGTQTVYVNQMQNNLTWVTLGTWSMSAGGGNVTLDAAGSSGGTSPQVIADVVKYEYVSP